VSQQPRNIQDNNIQDRGLHVGIIMDGSGRWGELRGKPRLEGHRRGARVARRIVEAAPGLGVRTLTLFTFSADNWARPEREVQTLMHLVRAFLDDVREPFAGNGICVEVIGRRDRLDAEMRQAIEATEAQTTGGATLHLRLAVDYSGREAILRAAHRLASHAAVGHEQLEHDVFRHHLASASHSSRPVPDVDLLIRTGGEQRLSDFLLWETAYAELHFTKLMWPDFGVADLANALRDFHSRQRRFGGLPVSA
jgi:undecaprenyl diphosphate synthase